MDRLKFFTIGMVPIMVLVGLSGCLGFGSDEEKGDPIPILYGSRAKGEMVKASNTFAFKLNNEMAKDGGNLFYSPYSISTALGMAYEGARGQTASEMRSVLSFPADNQTRLDLFKAIQTGINAPDDQYSLDTANAFWAQQGYPILDTYLAILTDYYLAHGETLDMRGDPVGSCDKINAWVEERTHDKIKDLLTPDNLGPLTALVLTNAIYFKGTWQYKFDSEATVKEKFLNSSGSEVDAEMMKMCDEDIELYYGEKDGLKILELPYDGSDLSMYIILPGDRTSSTDELNIDEGTFSDLHDSMRASWVDVWFPKFELEQKFGMVPILTDMGMPSAFGNAADFSGIDGTNNLCISEVIHQSYVKVDEEGTEAAAATAVVMVEKGGIGGGDEPQPEIFHADHPFKFVIQHKGTGSILFMGRINDPTV
jgi:serpin B